MEAAGRHGGCPALWAPGCPHPQVGDSGTQRPAAAGSSTAGLGSRVDYREPLRLQDPFLEFLQASWINGWRVRGWA